MNLANRLTLFRILLVPIFLVFLVTEGPSMRLYAFIVFALASATDFLDGFIARKYNMISTFGKFMDPLADKILVGAALIGLSALGEISLFIPFIIFTREFIVSGIRLVTVEQGIVIAASMAGKLKTVTQMVALMILIVSPELVNLSFYENVITTGQILLWLSALLTITSGVSYFVKSKDVLLKDC